MQAYHTTRVLVWSRWLRLSHWLIAISGIGLAATGWLMSNASFTSTSVREIHFILAGLLIPAILIRLYLLLFGRGTDHLSDCEPNLHRMKQSWEVLRFYLSLGKIPLPRWFGHNPLWGPIYLILFLFLIVSALSGVMLLQEIPFLFRISNQGLHQISYHVILVFTLLHLPAVFSHDLSNQNGDISGMVNGYKIFHGAPDKTGDTVETHTVSLDALLKTRK